MFSRRSHSCPIVSLAAAIVGLSVLTVELPAQGALATVSEALTNALAERDNLPAADGSLWRFEGPRNLQKGQIGGFGLSPHSGRINEIAIYPGDPQIMYATGATGGVWKTMDGGQQWASRSADWRIQAATAVAVDPRDPNRVFAGTGDYKRLDHVAPFSVGVMRSLDGGLTWIQSGAEEMREYTVSRIVIDPANSQNVLAATGRGSRLPGGRIFRSADAGATWGATTDPPEGNWDDLQWCGQNVLWASATRRKNLDADDPGNASGLVYKSTDRGLSWVKVNVSAGPFDLEHAGSPDTIHMTCNPSNDIVFLAVYTGGSVRVFSTPDFGGSWTERTAPLVVGSHSWAHSAFGVTRNFLFVGGTELFRGPLDAGGQLLPGGGFLRFPCAASTANPDPCPDDIPGPLLHGDYQCAVPHPTDADVVFLCHDGGVYRHVAPSNTTTSLSATLGVTQVYRMDVHPRHGGLIAVGMQDLGDSVSFFGNGNDPADLRDAPSWALVLGGDGRSAAFAQGNSSQVYLANTTGAVVGYDGAARKGLQSSDAANSQAPLLLRNNILYYADTTFWRLLDPGSQDTSVGPVNWMPSAFRSSGFLPATIQSLATCPTNTQVMYAASAEGEVFYSGDGGQTWRDDLDLTGVPELPIWAISPSPSNCQDVLIGAGYEGSVVRTGSNTFNAGDRLLRKADVLAPGAWTGVHGGPQALPHAPIFAIVRHPSAPASLWFAAGDLGVFRTDDGGAHWTNATAPLGLPNTLVRDLRLSEDGNTLYAGTFGRGVWSMDVSRPAADVFGMRGSVTLDGRPRSGEVVVVEGSGRIRKWLSNTITTDLLATTAGIAVAESAAISAALVSVSGSHLGSVKLVTPSGTELSMNLTSTSGSISTFSLSSSSAAALVGQQTRGSWSFKVSGAGDLINGTFVQYDPSVLAANVDFQFTDRVSNTTGPDGEYTIEYLRTGSHVVSIPGCATCRPVSIDVTSHRTNVDFELNVVSIATSAFNASESGNQGRFSVSRSGSTDKALTVSYTVGGTALNGKDYKTLPGSVVIPAGSPAATITVIAADDTVVENTETVILTLVPGTGYSVAQQSTALVQILDNDSLPMLAINNVTVPEGAAAVFTVTLSPASATTVKVNYATSNGTAIGGPLCPLGDYLARSGTLTFGSGVVSQIISVPTCADSITEAPETFLITLSGPVGAGISDGTGTGTIR